MEQEAITKLKNGDISGLDVLVDLYQAQARQVAFLISSDPALAEDIVQAAFLRAYERIDQFDAKRPFGPWFLRSVSNDAYKAMTRQRNISLDAHGSAVYTGELGNVASPDPALYEVIEAAETKEAIWATLERLSPRQRTSVIMRYYLDMSDAEIAQALGCPPGTVRRRLHDARERLRYLLPTWVKRPAQE